MTERDDYGMTQRAIRAAIDREQRRYEIARGVMAGLVSNDSHSPYLSDLAAHAVEAADALLAALDGKETA